MASAISACPPSCTIVTTVRATGQTRGEATTSSANTPLPRASHFGGTGCTVNAWCHAAPARCQNMPPIPDPRSPWPFP